jgi:hypothetical protein
VPCRVYYPVQQTLSAAAPKSDANTPATAATVFTGGSVLMPWLPDNEIKNFDQAFLMVNGKCRTTNVAADADADLLP